MSLSLQAARSTVGLSSSCSFYGHGNHDRRAAIGRISYCSRSPSPSPSPSVQEAFMAITDGDKGGSNRGDANFNVHSGIQVPRRRYIPVSKSVLLDAIVSDMFPSHEEARQFLFLSECLDSILHAEHKAILDEMRADFNVTVSAESKRVNHEDVTPLRSKDEADQVSGALINGLKESDSTYKEQKEEAYAEILKSSGLSIKWNMLFDLSSRSDWGISFKSSRVAIPSRFQHAFMKLLHDAEFEELSPGDLMLTSALNNDYLLTLPIYVDWKKAAASSAIIFRRGYTTERQKGLLLAEKLDYLQSKLLQNFFYLASKPLGRFAVWFSEASKSITQKQDVEVLTNKLKFWIKGLSVIMKPDSSDGDVFGDLKIVDILSNDFPIWVAAQKAVTRYEGILSEVGPRQRLLRRFLGWVGLAPSAPERNFDLHYRSSGYKSNQSLLSRISLADIWKPASPESCGNDLKKMLRTAFSLLFSQSVLQEPAFQELILLYTEQNGGVKATYQAEAPFLQMKIYERIPIPDLPVVFPHKKLSFRILDTVRLDVATILGLLAYFVSYKFEDISSSPSAFLLDLISTSALVLFVTRVLLGYKQTRDRYELLVNRTLYEKTVASGFGTIHFLLDASEQQQYKEAILVYATLLKVESGKDTTAREIADQCETFIDHVFQEKVEMPVEKAMETLVRLGLVVDVGGVDGDLVPRAIPCNIACTILRKRWNSLIK